MPDSDSSLLETFYGTKLVPELSAMQAQNVIATPDNHENTSADQQFQRKRRHKMLDFDEYGQKCPRKRTVKSNLEKMRKFLKAPDVSNIRAGRRITIPAKRSIWREKQRSSQSSTAQVPPRSTGQAIRQINFGHHTQNRPEDITKEAYVNPEPPSSLSILSWPTSPKYCSQPVEQQIASPRLTESELSGGAQAEIEEIGRPQTRHADSVTNYLTPDEPLFLGAIPRVVEKEAFRSPMKCFWIAQHDQMESTSIKRHASANNLPDYTPDFFSDSLESTMSSVVTLPGFWRPYYR